MGEKFYAEPQSIDPSQEIGAGAGRFPAYPIAGWDPADGLIKVLNLGVLVDPLVLAEKAHAIDKIDARNGVTVQVPATAVVNDVLTGVITVPAGEVWLLNRMQIVCPVADATGSVSFNVLVSPWPKTAAGTDKPYWAANQAAMGATTTVEFIAQGELGEELRLKAGDKLTLSLLVTVNFSAIKNFTLNVFGRKGKKILA